MNYKIRYVFEALRNNIVYKELKVIDGGQIICDASASIKRSITCSAVVPPDVDFMTDELRASMILNGVKYTLGVFNITTTPATVDANGTRLYHLEGYDRTYKLQQKKTETRNEGFIQAGVKYTDKIKELLTTAGITNYICEESPLTVPADREEKAPGTSYLTIINELLNEINYNSIWFDSEGFARCEKYISPVEKAPTFSYRAGANSIIMRAHEISNDAFDACNVFIVGVSNSETTIYKTAVNDDPLSKLSTVNRGRIVAPLVMLDSTADETTAQEYAENLKLKSMLSNETLKIKTGVDRQHEIFDVVAVDLPEVSGKFSEVGWSLTMDGSGLMSHTLRRAVYL